MGNSLRLPREESDAEPEVRWRFTARPSVIDPSSPSDTVYVPSVDGVINAIRALGERMSGGDLVEVEFEFAMRVKRRERAR
jgi:hypothetical protein